jgi:MacB-like periplasmic core domain
MISVEVKGRVESSAVLVVSHDYYQTYPVHPILGRTLLPSDFQRAANAAVISEQCWRKRYGSDPAVLGKIIRIESRAFSVVGVMPSRFSSPQIDVSADATIPVEASAHVALDYPLNLFSAERRGTAPRRDLARGGADAIPDAVAIKSSATRSLLR